MKIRYELDNVGTLQLFDEPPSYDAMIVACGYEQRSVVLAEEVASGVTAKLAMCFLSKKDELARPRNEAILRQNGWNIRDISGEDFAGAFREVSEFLRRLERRSHELRLLIDVSSMTKMWHAAVIAAVRSMAAADGSPEQPLCVDFAYVPRHYQDPPIDFVPNEYVGPLRGFASIEPAPAALALGLGLGYERDRALGLQLVLDPSITLAFVPSGRVDSRFDAAVRQSNVDVLRRLDDAYVIPYPLHDPAATFHLVNHVCRVVSERAHVVLAPLGPKIFAITCMLIACKSPSVSVWRASPAGREEPQDARADRARACGLRTRWSSRNTAALASSSVDWLHEYR